MSLNLGDSRSNVCTNRAPKIGTWTPQGGFKFNGTPHRVLGKLAGNLKVGGGVGKREREADGATKQSNGDEVDGSAGDTGGVSKLGAGDGVNNHNGETGGATKEDIGDLNVSNEASQSGIGMDWQSDQKIEDRKLSDGSDKSASHGHGISV